jgi:hypothetical protein
MFVKCVKYDKDGDGQEILHDSSNLLFLFFFFFLWC